VRVYKDDGLVHVGKEMIVRGEFDIIKLSHWRRLLQAELDLENPKVPYYPEYTIYQYEYKDDKFNKIRENPRIYKMDEIKRIVEEYYSSTICKDLDITDTIYEKRELVEMRYVVMVVCKVLTPFSQRQIGKLYHKNHATVTHAKKAIKNWYATEQEFRKRIASLSDELNEPLGEKIKNL
jgi:hypothetical protein